jgi:predicted O-methyltransferase YrrM
LRRPIRTVEFGVLYQPDSFPANYDHSGDVLGLMHKVMEYRSHEIRQQLVKVGSEASMLHLDVLFLIYHFAKVATGNILEIGPYVGGSTVAAALGARESGRAKKIISVEPGGRLEHFKIPSKNIFKDLKKNLARFGVLNDIMVINGRSFDETAQLAVRRSFRAGDVGLFLFDADDNVRRDLDYYGDLLSDGCWLVIDDYFGPGAKAVPIRAQVDELMSLGRLRPFGYYGWGTWVGQWQP